MTTRPIETDLARGKDARHTAAAELALDRVGAAEGLCEVLEEGIDLEPA